MITGFINRGGHHIKNGSKSGWEKSWFGGYRRMVMDHPDVTIPWEVKIVPSRGLVTEFGIYYAEKVIKLLILNANKLSYTGRFPREVITKKDFAGNDLKIQRILFNESKLLDVIISQCGEISPLFSHYKKEILASYAESVLKEPPPQGKAEEGSGSGKKEEGDKNPDRGEQGEGEEQEEQERPSGETGFLDSLLGQAKERAPFVYSKSISTFDKKAEFIPIPLPARLEPHKFSANEISAAEHLVKLLDISFDPKSDVVKSLRLGKLDTSKIAEVPAGNLSIYKQIVEEQDTRPFTVCILADMSGSMTGSKQRSQLTVLNSLYLAMKEILPDDKLFIYGHSGEASPEIYTFYSPYEQEYETKIQGYFRVDWCQNYDGPVIEEIHKKVRSFTDDRIIFISLSDGGPCGRNYGSMDDLKNLKQIVEKCRRDDFVTVGIGIQSDAVEEIYTYSKVVRDLEDLSKDISGVINRVVRQEFM
jgi:hypothetical protein